MRDIDTLLAQLTTAITEQAGALADVTALAAKYHEQLAALAGASLPSTPPPPASPVEKRKISVGTAEEWMSVAEGARDCDILITADMSPPESVGLGANVSVIGSKPEGGAPMIHINGGWVNVFGDDVFVGNLRFATDPASPGMATAVQTGCPQDKSTIKRLRLHRIELAGNMGTLLNLEQGAEDVIVSDVAAPHGMRGYGVLGIPAAGRRVEDVSIFRMKIAACDALPAGEKGQHAVRFAGDVKSVSLEGCEIHAVPNKRSLFSLLGGADFRVIDCRFIGAGWAGDAAYLAIGPNPQDRATDSVADVTLRGCAFSDGAAVDVREATARVFIESCRGGMVVIHPGMAATMDGVERGEGQWTMG